MRYLLSCFLAAAFTLPALSGCSELASAMSPSWHGKYNWQAKDYFDDPKVIALCSAIEANDIAAIDRVVKAGADVNAKGKDNMTPLLWAFPDNKLDRFKRLLEHGADPNVIFKSDFGTQSNIMAGESVTLLACETSFPGYFDAVFDHKGDPNFVSKSVSLGANNSPLISVIVGRAPAKNEKVKRLIEKAANLDHLGSAGMTATMQAVCRDGRFDIALMLLEAGADPKVYQENELQKLTHVVVRQDGGVAHLPPQQKADYDKLVKWLEDHGESLPAARTDIKRWDSWKRWSGEFERKTKAEIAARKAREAKQKAAAEKKPN